MTAAGEARPPHGLAMLVGLVVVTLGIGWLGGRITQPAIATWYAGLAKPAFNPPNWVFAPVWTALYLAMALAAWLAWRGAPADRRGRLLAPYAVQLALNLLWSALFFGLQRPDLALIEIAALWLAIAWTALTFRPLSRGAAWLLVPYLAWVAYAAALNLAIWRLN